ncbi:proline--tRNA ligase [Patescibacteria group bacterium]
MKYSRLFGKTEVENQKGSKMASNQLLLRAGFIRESAAGRYYFLPLGWRVHEKIKTLIKEEMDASGAQEMISPVLHPLELWQETNRTSTTGFELMRVKDRRGAEFALGGTAEEMFVDLVRKFQLSYKDLPFNIYQFSTKFRDELRARGGLLRVREFMMKDAYSFDVNEKSFKLEYEKMEKTYTKIFERLGLKTHVVEADNGYIGGEYCHEFQAEHPEGEGRFFVTEDGSYAAHEDVANFDIPHMNESEELREFEIINQPEWVQTMEDNVKHYGEPEWRYLKNVVYRTTQGDLVIVSLRGDMEVNKTKVEQLLGLVGQLDDATDEDLEAIGTKRGYVHCWDHKFVSPRKTADESRDCKVICVADESLKSVKNFIGGQKEEKTDSSNVNYGRDFTHEIEGCVSMAQDGFLYKGKKLVEKRGIEVGNIFQLGHHYTSLMKGASFVDKYGKEKPYYMGCYGIGLGRTMATIVELYHDEKGIVWPKEIAPFRVHLITLSGMENEGAVLYEKLKQNGVEVFWDDRDASPGEKFADADLMGMPVRLVLSSRNEGKVELKLRNSDKAELYTTEEVIAEAAA